MLFTHSKTKPVSPENALPGRDHYEFAVPTAHYVTGRPIKPPFPDGLEEIVFGLGCFWGAEEIFWQTHGVWTTAVGYAGGYTPHPSYEEVCTGRTGHTESVLVVFDPAEVALPQLLATFFEVHDPTQGMRQGNDIGTQYRSAIYYTRPEHRGPAEQATATYSEHLQSLGYGPTTTEIAAGGLDPLGTGAPVSGTPLSVFYYAEGYHQQYLAKNPNGYRCHAATGVPFPA
jgi:peptide-methionine (S)-S-oxide reductase